MKIKNLLLTLFVLSFLSCYSKPSPPPENEETAEETVKPEHYALTLAAAGDNLFHDTLIKDGLKDGVYNYESVYSQIKDIIVNADLAFINQETVMAGEKYGYSGFPAFNTPQPLAKNLADTGFDIINLANNHAMDMGKSGLEATLELLEKTEGITVVGARREGESARIITKNNITLGFLSYAHSLNGNPLPAENTNLVSMINRNKMTAEIEALRPLCDFLIVSMHWGDEYTTEPAASQTELARFLAERKVDLIIGHHPHVLQRAETIVMEDGRKTLCFYSLGNFASHQRGRERIIGAIMTVTFTKEKKEADYILSVSDFGTIPVICHFDRTYANTVIYPLYSYTDELLQNHAIKNYDKELSMDFFYTVMKRMQTKIFMHNPFKK